MRRSSCAGGPTSRRRSAATTSSRSRSPTSSRTCSGPVDGSAERHFLFRRLYARRLVPRLAVMRRPGCIALPIALVCRHQLEQRLQRVGPAIDSLVRVAALFETQRHRLQREVSRIAGLELIPLDRRGYGRLGCRPYRICAGDRPIARILVVVDENAVAFLLPPLRRRELRRAALHFTCQRER